MGQLTTSAAAGINKVARDVLEVGRGRGMRYVGDVHGHGEWVCIAANIIPTALAVGIISAAIHKAWVAAFDIHGAPSRRAL